MCNLPYLLRSMRKQKSCSGFFPYYKIIPYYLCNIAESLCIWNCCCIVNVPGSWYWRLICGKLGRGVGYISPLLEPKPPSFSSEFSIRTHLSIWWSDMYRPISAYSSRAGVGNFQPVGHVRPARPFDQAIQECTYFKSWNNYCLKLTFHLLVICQIFY